MKQSATKVLSLLMALIMLTALLPVKMALASTTEDPGFFSFEETDHGFSSAFTGTLDTDHVYAGDYAYKLTLPHYSQLSLYDVFDNGVESGGTIRFYLYTEEPEKIKYAGFIIKDFNWRSYEVAPGPLHSGWNEIVLRLPDENAVPAPLFTQNGRNGFIEMKLELEPTTGNSTVLWLDSFRAVPSSPGPTPTPQPTATPDPSPTPEPSPTPDPSPTPTPQPTPTPNPGDDASHFNFESSLHGFQAGTGHTLTVDSTRAYLGNSSMRISPNPSGEAWQEVGIWVNDPGLVPGQKVSFSIYIPNQTDLAMQVYSYDAQWRWSDLAWYQALPKNQWVELEFTIPSTYTSNAAMLGIKFWPQNGESFWLDSFVLKEVSVPSDILFDFEAGNVNGFSADSPVTLSADSSQAFEGQFSMRADYRTGYTTFYLPLENVALSGGDIIRFSFWVPQNASVSLQPFHMDSQWGNWTGYWFDSSTIVNGQWNVVSFQIPDSYSMPFGQWGIQIFSNQSTGSVWFDHFVKSVDKDGLSALIQTARSLLDNSVAGTQPGQFPAEAFAPLNQAADEALLVYNNENATSTQVSQAKSALDKAIALFLASRIMAPETISINYDNVINDIQHPFWGVNYVAFWDENQGSTGSREALRRAGIDYIRFPGGVPGNWYDWATPSEWTPTRPLDLWNYAQGAGAGILWQTNTTDNAVNDSGTRNDPSGAHVQAMMDDFAAKGIDVLYYEVGNEMDLELLDPSGPPRQPAYQEYIDAYQIQAGAIRAKDPNAFILGPAATNTWYWWGLDALGMFLEQAGNRQGTGLVDGISLHWYPAYEKGWDYAKKIASTWQENMDFIKDTIETYDTRDLPLFITETSAAYTNRPDDLDENAKVSGALATADMLGAFRNSGVQSVALFGAIHWVDNNWGLFYNEGEARPLDTPTPIYYTLPLWTKSGNRVLEVEALTDSVNELSAYASKKDDGSAQVVIINKLAGDREVTVSFDGLSLTGAQVEIYELKPSDGTLNDLDVYYNGEFMPQPASQELPDPFEDTCLNTVYTHTVPGYSVTLIQFTPAQN